MRIEASTAVRRTTRQVLLCGATLLGVTGCIDVPTLTFEALDATRNAVTDARAGDAAGDAVSSPGSPDTAPIGGSPDAAPIGGSPDATAVGSTPDAAPDAAILPLVPDAAVLPLVPDAALPVPDARLPDAALPDAALPVPDARLPDAALLDAALPDAAPLLPDAAPLLPDAAPPPPPVIQPVPAPIPGLKFGTTVAVVPDQNADGFADVVVGAPNVNAGADAYVFLHDGRTGMELSHYLKPGDSGSFGTVLLVADADGDGAIEVLLGEPLGTNGRGRVRVLGLPALQQVASLTGDQANSGFGTALAVARGADAAPRILATAAGPQANDQLYLLRLRLVQPGLLELAREQSFTLDGAAHWDIYGRAVVTAPNGAPGTLDDAIVSGLDAGPRVGRVSRFTLGANVRTVTEYLPELPTETAGAALLVLPTQPPQLAVGDPRGPRGGVVSIFPRDAGGGGGGLPPTLELHSRAAGEAFGTALTTAPLLSGPGRSSGGLCVGAPATGAGIGRVECMDATSPDAYLSLEGPAGAAFGTSVSAGATLDPDGTWLMAVGAPMNAVPGRGQTGAVMLIRVTPPATP